MSERPPHVRGTLAFCVCAALLAASALRADEIVTLRSGFTITCSTHEAISPDTVRLILTAGKTDYMDVPLASVLGVDAIARQEPKPRDVEGMPSNRSLPEIAQSSGAAHNVNTTLLLSVIHAESAGNTRAVSRTGARGLMQLMPATAAQLNVHDSFVPEDNVNGGSAYLDGLLTRYHENVALALAAYNAGPAAVDRYRGIPPYRETRLYVARVLREFNRLVQNQHASNIAAVLPQGASR
ncbi:MAG: transglycosylase SLT domain-containing protein [Janthinobacterium lividum]